MADMEEVEVVVAHNERATLRVGDVFLKIDADQTRTDVEVEAMVMAPIPTPANASGSSRTASFPPTWSRATAGLPRLRSGRGHRCSRTATCRSTTCSSTRTRSPA
jgi:hypothetical protein